MKSDDGQEKAGSSQPRSTQHFAFLPKKLKDGRWIWLQHYRRARSIFE